MRGLEIRTLGARLLLQDSKQQVAEQGTCDALEGQASGAPHHSSPAAGGWPKPELLDQRQDPAGRQTKLEKDIFQKQGEGKGREVPDVSMGLRQQAPASQ